MSQRGSLLIFTWSFETQIDENAWQMHRNRIIFTISRIIPSRYQLTREFKNVSHSKIKARQNRRHIRYNTYT